MKKTAVRETTIITKRIMRSLHKYNINVRHVEKV